MKPSTKGVVDVVFCLDASGSMAPGHGHDIAAWYLYRISRMKGLWQTDVSVRQWQPQAGIFSETRTFSLTSAMASGESAAHAHHP